MFWKNVLFASSLCFVNLTFSQFSGPVNTPTSSAIHKDSSIIVGWANHCILERGRNDISNPNAPLASFGEAMDAIGPADELSIVSLGDSGIATLTFAHPIFNGQGPDFAVFENSFSDSFLELAHVEVSSDGINFFRFPSDFLQTNLPQNGPYDQFGNPEKINNLAGKYPSGYGTPFDLEDMLGIAGLNVNAITHVRLIDAVGQISGPYGTTDQNGHFVNDPFPTPFPSGGFDLDAVGVMYLSGINEIQELNLPAFVFYPNPTKDFIQITSSYLSFELEIINELGQIMLKSTLNHVDLRALDSGVYLIRMKNTDGVSLVQKLIKR